MKEEGSAAGAAAVVKVVVADVAEQEEALAELMGVGGKEQRE